ncbi:MAG: hypothetical protein RI922_2368 [Bacteroidota bacterium]
MILLRKTAKSKLLLNYKAVQQKKLTTIEIRILREFHRKKPSKLAQMGQRKIAVSRSLMVSKSVANEHFFLKN